ncbi:hypothetical protein [Streptomyces sp. NPDC096311]|uniref:hypothetical protein n=1 Tax=Streptomyces sp. NPDC096311 TaxID=3366083 RepID=UPI003816706F
MYDRVRTIAPQGVDAALDASGRGEIPDSIELVGSPARVLTLVACDAADTGIQVLLRTVRPRRILLCARRHVRRAAP